MFLEGKETVMLLIRTVAQDTITTHPIRENRPISLSLGHIMLEQKEGVTGQLAVQFKSFPPLIEVFTREA